MLRLMRMCVWNSMPVWISYRSFWQKWNFISGDKISCKHYPKWNAYTCPSKYRVVLKCSRNETSCEQNLFSRRFEISNRYEFISPLMWTYSYSNSIAFMNGLYLMWKGCRKLKSWVQVNVLCIVEQDHKWWVIAVDHTSRRITRAGREGRSPLPFFKNWKKVY